LGVAYAAELEKRIHPHLRMSNGSCRVDETYVKVKGRWIYLYRAVDSRGQTIDFQLSAKRDADAAKRFFRKALAQPHTVNLRTITVDKNAAYPKATTEMKKDGELWRRSRLRQVKYLNNIVEQDHRCVDRLTRPGLGFVAFGQPDGRWQATRRWGKFGTASAATSGPTRSSSPDCSRRPLETSSGVLAVARGPARNLATEPARRHHAYAAEDRSRQSPSYPIRTVRIRCA
jgi:hypothetical protein